MISTIFLPQVNSEMLTGIKIVAVFSGHYFKQSDHFKPRVYILCTKVVENFWIILEYKLWDLVEVGGALQSLHCQLIFKLRKNEQAYICIFFH